MAPSRCSVDCPNILQNVLKVLDLILLNHCTPGKKKKIKPIRDVYSLFASQKIHLVKITGNTVNKNCVELMNKSLCSHRYETAAKLLWIICQDSKVFGSFIFKAAMVTFDNLSFHNKEEFMLNLMRNAQKLEKIIRKEIQLEYMIYGMQNNIPDLQKTTKEILFVSRIKNDIIDSAFEAYSSFLQYADCFGNIGEVQLSQAKLTAEMTTIVQFKNIVASQGNWDVFILKLVKMLDFCDRSNEIEDVLLKYVEHNPDNLNAHIYLCVYLCEYCADTEKVTHHLQALAKLCPSDERILFLLEKLGISEKKLKECLKLTFMFLDYPSNGRNLKAWQLLSHFLCQVKLRNCHDELKKTRSLWKFRRKCWYWLYFNPSQVPCLSECDYHLTEIKINVLSYFDLDHKYIQEASKKFPSMELDS